MLCKNWNLKLNLAKTKANCEINVISQISEKHNSRRAPPELTDSALPLWMWGVKEKDMALYKLLSEIIPKLSVLYTFKLPEL